jgi:hypothetical protein
MKRALKKSVLTGDTPRLTGDLSGLWGNVTDLRGDVTGVQGDLDGCDLTPEDRAAGVLISDLVEVPRDC